MDLYNNMEFEVKSCFMPNISSSDRLKILELTHASAIIQMNNSNYRGVFPLESLQYWIQKGSLQHID
jgi:hypothetical protein